jgi:hypothetical protein
VSLGFLEVVGLIQRVHPCFDKELSPVAILEDVTVSYQPNFVLADDKIRVLAPQVREGLDDTVWRHYRPVLDH